MKLKNTILCAMALGISYATFSQTNIPKKFQPDDKVKKYVTTSYFRNSNAGYLSISDLMQRMIGIGFQRQLFRGYWGELGISKSYKSYKLNNFEFNNIFTYSSRLQLANFYSRDYYSIDTFEMNNKFGVNVGFFKATIGYPLFSSFSYGIKLKYNVYGVKYILEDSRGTGSPNQLVDNNVVRTSIMPTLAYRTHLYKGLSMDLAPYFDIFTSSSRDSKIINDPYSNLKKSSVGVGFNLNFTYSF